MARRARTDGHDAKVVSKALPTSSDPIAIGLKQLFATVAEEPVPDEFLNLLDRIEAQERARAAETADPGAAPAPGIAT